MNPSPAVSPVTKLVRRSTMQLASDMSSMRVTLTSEAPPDADQMPTPRPSSHPSLSQDEPSWRVLVHVLEAAYHSRRAVSVTWLNHYSARVALDEPSLKTFDVVGVDGKLLQFILRGRHRTSADLVLPALLPRLDGARVAIVGGEPETLRERRAAVESLLPPTAAVVLAFDGFAQLPSPARFGAAITTYDADIVIVALGAGLQEVYAASAKAAFQHGGIAVTCGGLLDQLLTPGYYPTWAYPLRLNWLVRLMREPRRLWRRYTFDAIRALGRATHLRRRTRALQGLWV
jgi:exopolysaccharide biosynthesis WecB/TagA/CpsF family protein